MAFRLPPFRYCSIAYKQKSGTAILLFRWLRLWYCPQFKTTTLKPTPYAQMRALCAYINYIPMGILCCYVLEFNEFTRFRTAKTKRVRRLLYVRIYPPLKNIFPRRGRIRLQRYKNILNYANENAKNVRNVCKKI